MFLLLICIDYDNDQPIMLMHGKKHDHVEKLPQGFYDVNMI